MNGARSGDHAGAVALADESTAGRFPRSHPAGEVERLDALLTQDAGYAARAGAGSARDDHRSTLRQSFHRLGCDVLGRNMNRPGNVAGIPLRVISNVEQRSSRTQHLDGLIGLDGRQLESVEESHGPSL